MKAAWNRDHRAEVQRHKNAHIYNHPHNIVDLEDKTNVTIIDQHTQHTILQRLSPSSARTESNLNAMFVEGIELKRQLFDIAV